MIATPVRLSAQQLLHMFLWRIRQHKHHLVDAREVCEDVREHGMTVELEIHVYSGLLCELRSRNIPMSSGLLPGSELRKKLVMTVV